MRIYQIDPLSDARWPKFVEGHAKASVFHTVGWLKALKRTYGYEPVVFTTSSPTGELMNGLLFCRIDSWLTGHRLVSLPFSDHCEPLCDSEDDLSFLIGYLQTTMERQNLKYVEVRPVNERLGQISERTGFRPAARFYLHILDLRRDLDEVFRSLDRDSVQRRVQRAQRAGLTEKTGRSEDLLKEFYTLFVATRSRHRLPPSPYSWFQNLIRCKGDALEIRLAYSDGIPISAILTLRFRETAYYKYGCSEIRSKGFGATPWLLWNAVVAAKSNGAMNFDLGRTEEDNTGLLAFKNHWVPKPGSLDYWRFPDISSSSSRQHWKLKAVKRAFSFMPNGLLRVLGGIVYRHIG